MDQPIHVYVDLDGKPHLAGRLWAHRGGRRESASFEYDQRWLANARRFALEPALTLDPGPHHTGEGRALFGAIGDSAPDRWGRVLIQREELRRARAENRQEHQDKFAGRLPIVTRGGSNSMSATPNARASAILRCVPEKTRLW